MQEGKIYWWWNVIPFNPVIGTITNSPILPAPTATTSTVTVPVNAGTGVGT
jgi:hypothetical protein